MARRRIAPGMFVPDVKNEEEMRTFVDFVVERLETTTGDRGFPKSRNVTVEDLEDAGLVTVDEVSGQAQITSAVAGEGGTVTTVVGSGSSFNPSLAGVGTGDVLRYSPPAKNFSTAGLFDSSDLILDEVVQESNVTQHRFAVVQVPTTSFSADQNVELVNQCANLEFTGDGTAGNNTLTIQDQATIAYENGAWFEVFNVGTGNLTIALGVGVTLRWMDGGGVLNSAARTLAIAGWARIARTASDVWVIRGEGLT